MNEVEGRSVEEEASQAWCLSPQNEFPLADASKARKRSKLLASTSA